VTAPCGSRTVDSATAGGFRDDVSPTTRAVRLRAIRAGDRYRRTVAASEIEPDRSSTLAEHLLRQGVPPSLLIDLIDPAGMEAALQSELAEVQTRRVLAETTPRHEQGDAATA